MSILKFSNHRQLKDILRCTTILNCVENLLFFYRVHKARVRKIINLETHQAYGKNFGKKFPIFDIMEHFKKKTEFKIFVIYFRF